MFTITPIKYTDLEKQMKAKDLYIESLHAALQREIEGRENVTNQLIALSHQVIDNTKHL